MADRPPAAVRSLPHWQLDSIYKGVDSPRYLSDQQRLSDQLAQLEQLLRTVAVDHNAHDPGTAATWLRSCLTLVNSISDLHENLDAYVYARYSVDTADTHAVREVNRIQQLILPLYRLLPIFRSQLADLLQAAAEENAAASGGGGDDTDEAVLSHALDRLAAADEVVAEHRYFLGEQLAERQHQMSPQEEDLAADLARSGADAWSRLQESISSQLNVQWRPGEWRTVVELRGMAHNGERAVRRRAFELEVGAWQSMATPLAYALNGVKGHSIVVDQRRGYETPLDRALFLSRLSRNGLETMILVMEESLPVFRDYLNTKARALGLERLAFYDLFAPLGRTRSWSYSEAMSFIASRFASFSPELAQFADAVAQKNWIDAEPRPGKVGGAYCISMPLAGESRILANFDGSTAAVFTLAHELGHAYHHQLLKNAPASRRDYPMTLAETASIFCESIVLEGALSAVPRSDGEMERIALIDLFLQDATQVVVDILSRYYFEQAIFHRREHGELSAADLCHSMREAQLATYGDALDSDSLHPYMWAVKGHYYRHDLAFYNFPYAFGLLFALSLYQQYRDSPAGFVARYRALLADSGSASTDAVAAAAGLAVTDPDCWRQALHPIAARVQEFAGLVDAAAKD